MMSGSPHKRNRESRSEEWESMPSMQDPSGNGPAANASAEEAEEVTGVLPAQAAAPEKVLNLHRYHHPVLASSDDDDEVTAEEEENEEEREEDDGSASYSDSASEYDTDEMSQRGIKEDKARHYPRFTSDYARECRHDLVPFLREEPLPPAAAEETVYYSMCSPASQSQQSGVKAGKTSDAVADTAAEPTRIVLYGEYVYLCTLGKGTFSKVVLATRYTHGVGVDTDAPLVAIKIFRDENSYREACWDEVCILRSLCRASGCGAAGAGAATEGEGGLQSGLGSYYSNIGRFVAPLQYIPHPQHAAMVLPLLGPSLLQVLRTIKQASRACAKQSSAPTTTTPATRRSSTEGGAGDGAADRVWLRGLPLPLLRAVIYQVLTFLAYIHARGAVHTDLKPENVLFESTTMLPTTVPAFLRKAKLTLNECPTGPLSQQSGHADPAVSTSIGFLASMKKLHDSYKLTSAAAQRRAASHSSQPRSEAMEEADVDGEVNIAHWVTVQMPMLNAVRVVDLGAAQFVSGFKHVSTRDRVTPVCYDPIQTSHYRCPEVLMDIGWSTEADIFSLGCMIPELASGECLFMPNDALEHLALMQRIIGPFRDPDGKCEDVVSNVFSANRRTLEYFFNTETGELKWPATQDILREQRQRALENAARARAGIPANDNGDDSRSEVSELDPFVETSWKDIQFVLEKPTISHLLGHIPHLEDLTRRMLAYDPLSRITAEEALRHPFFHST